MGGGFQSEQPDHAQAADQRVGDDQAAKIDNGGGDHQRDETGQPDEIRIAHFCMPLDPALRPGDRPRPHRRGWAAMAGGRDGCVRPGMMASKAMLNETVIVDAIG